MKITFNDNLSVITPEAKCYLAGKTYEVEDKAAMAFVGNGLAEAVDAEPVEAKKIASVKMTKAESTKV